MKIALLADIHLSDLISTPQEAGLDWALRELNEICPNVCVWLGDLTACGSPDAALRFCKKISSLPCPSVIVPGNSDLRTESSAPMLARFLFNYPNGLRTNGVHIIGFDNARARILPEERVRLSRIQTGDRILLCSHEPAKYMDKESIEFLNGWIADQQRNGKEILLWASGHRHLFEESEYHGIPTVSVRALDLDKCRDGSAQILLWDPDTRLFEEHSYTEVLPDQWTREERYELADSLGITCYNRTKLDRDMPFAIQNRVKHLEWRNIEEGELPLIEEWRRVGGKTFSLHMTALNYGNGVIGKEELLRAAQNALRAGADMVTVHPPQIPHKQMRIGLPAFEATADAMAEAFLPLAENGIDILVENNHTAPNTLEAPEQLPYGCAPIDLVGWKNALNERLGKNACHLRLDIGHARNNEPLSEAYPVGKWYASVGDEARAYHLHQTIHDKVRHCLSNHHPILGWHNGFVAFDGFLWAWHEGILRHGPVILEIREGEGAPASWLRLRELLLGKPL